MIPLPQNATQSFTLRRPPGQGFWRKATCEEIDCEHWRNGWCTRVDVSTDLGQAQADYIARHSGRKITRQYREGNLTTFEFEAGQACFGAAGHRIAIEREPIYLHRTGLAAPRRHARGADWMEHMHEQTDKIVTLKERG